LHHRECCLRHERSCSFIRCDENSCHPYAIRNWWLQCFGSVEFKRKVTSLIPPTRYYITYDNSQSAKKLKQRNPRRKMIEKKVNLPQVGLGLQDQAGLALTFQHNITNTSEVPLNHPCVYVNTSDTSLPTQISSVRSVFVSFICTLNPLSY